MGVLGHPCPWCQDELELIAAIIPSHCARKLSLLDGVGMPGSYICYVYVIRTI